LLVRLSYYYECWSKGFGGKKKGGGTKNQVYFRVMKNKTEPMKNINRYYSDIILCTLDENRDD